MSLVDLSILVDAPAVVAVVRNPYTDVAPVAFVAASATTVAHAVRKAVVEAFQTRTWAKAEQREGSVIDPSKGWEQVVDFDDHVRLSLHPAAVEASRFIDSSVDRVSIVDVGSSVDLDDHRPGRALDDLLARLDRQGVELIAVDVTSPDVAEGGLTVARVFSPQLHPLDAGYSHRFLGGKRLRHRPADVGLVPHPLRDDELNDWPHLFP